MSTILNSRFLAKCFITNWCIFCLIPVFGSAALTQDIVPTTKTETYWPTTDSAWKTIRPGDTPVDAVKLKEALDYAGEKHSKGVVVLVQGKILAEQYWDDFSRDSDHSLYSATKSMVSVMIGMAIEDGMASNWSAPTGSRNQPNRGTTGSIRPMVFFGGSMEVPRTTCP